MSEENVTQMQAEPPKKLVARFAERFGVEPNKLLKTLKATAFRQREGKDVTDEQMQALLIVAEQYHLNPWTKEIYAFEDKGGIIPVVSVDGWSRIINSDAAMDGIEFIYAGAVVAHEKAEHKPCPAWVECVIRRKDRSTPIVVREYLDEVYQPPRGQYKTPGPWQSHTKRMLRHKAMIQCARIAFGFAGIYDEDEAERIMDRQEGPQVKVGPPSIEDEAKAIEAMNADGEVVLDLRTAKPAATVTSGRSSVPYAEQGQKAPLAPPPIDDPEDTPFTEVVSDPEDFAQALADIADAEDMFALSAVLDEFSAAREEWSQLERERFDEAYNRKSAQLGG